MGQSPFLTKPLMMYLGNRYPAALGLLEYAQWHIGVERIQQFSTATYQQHMTWVRPTAGDRWTLGLHITKEERFVIKQQQGSVGWAFRLPLTPRKNIYLGTRIHGSSSMYSFELLQHIERPDPLLDLPNHFWMAFSTSLAYQSKQGYVLLGVNNSPLSRTKTPLSLITAPSYYLLLGRTFDFDTAVQMKSVIGIEKEVAAPVYFGFCYPSVPKGYLGPGPLLRGDSIAIWVDCYYLSSGHSVLPVSGLPLLVSNGRIAIGVLLFEPTIGFGDDVVNKAKQLLVAVVGYPNNNSFSTLFSQPRAFEQ